MSKKEKLQEVLKNKPGYLKKGPEYLANRYNLSLEDVKSALKEVKQAIKQQNKDLYKGLEEVIEPKEVYNFKVPEIKIIDKKGKGLYRILVLSDIHGVFIDHKAWEVVLAIIANNTFDEIILNGDILDFPLISRFDKKLFDIPILKNYSETLEIEFTKQVILQPLKDLAPESRIIFRLGNHEERLTEGKYSVAAERIAKVFKNYNTSELDQMLELDKIGIEYDPSNVRNYFNQFDVVHGLSLSKNAPGKNIYEYMGSGTSGHSHRMNSTYIRNKHNSYVWVESGCLRTVDNVEYIPTAKVADWMQGFVTVVFDRDTDLFYVKSHPIIEGTCEFNGIVYK